MDQNNEDWRELCKAAANELDPTKLMNLITKLNRALDEQDNKQRRPSKENREGGTFQTEPAI
jgi:hypothetical protein